MAPTQVQYLLSPYGLTLVMKHLLVHSLQKGQKCSTDVTVLAAKLD